MASASCAGPLPPYPPFEASRAVVAERPARVEGFAFAVSVDDADDTSLRTPAAGVHLSAARAAFGSFGQRVHCSPFSWVRKPRPQAASRRRGKGAASPGYACYGWLHLSPGARRERLQRRTLAARERKRQCFSSLLPSWYRYVLAFTGLAVLAASVRLGVWRTASWSLEEPWPQRVLIE